MKYRIYRTLGLLFGLAAAVGMTVRLLPSSDSTLDDAASRQIRRLCGSRVQCEVRLRDLLPQRFDTYYVFNFDISNPPMSSMLGRKRPAAHSLQRNIVLARNGRVVLHEYADMSVDRPYPNQVVLECPTEENGWMRCSANDLFRVYVHVASGESVFGSHPSWYELSDVQ